MPGSSTLMQRANASGAGGEALAGLATEHAGALYRLALSLVRDHARAEDLVQDTLLRAIERGHQRRGAAARPWLRRILFNLAVDEHRRHSRELLVDEVEERWSDDAFSVDAASVLETAEQREELEDALARLPFAYRAAVVLHDVEGLKVAEIADVEGIGLPAAKQRLRRGRMMMVDALAAGARRRLSLEGVPMRCWDARRLVSDYLDGDLGPDDRRILEQHLERCPTCPPLYASLVGVRARLDALRDPDAVIPPGLAQRIASARSRV